MSTTSTSGVTLHGELGPDAERVLTPDALALVADLHRTFNHERERLLRNRLERQDAIAKGGTLDFLEETKEVREGDWKVADPHPSYLDRRVEITGPTSRKMVINALNSGAKGFMADFEDANSPTGPNMISGQANLTEAIEGTIEHSENGKEYALNDEVATLLIRPRGWHLIDRHIKVDGGPVSGSLMDAGLYLFHNSQRLIDKDRTPLLYLPKMESHLEARLWNSVFEHVQDAVGVPRGSVRATVLIETIPAAFEMDEILYELREHSGGLNAGRWDYIFSFIKTFREREEAILPDRAKVTMTVPFMRAYTELLVQTCHKRGAFAMGGMSAFIPSRKNQEINEKAFKQVADDKKREAGRRLRRLVGRAPRLGAGGDGAVRRGAGRPAQPDRQAAPRRRTSPPRSCSTPPRPARTARRTACARTSTSASSTSPRGCAATAPRGSSTSWRTPRRRRSRARRCGSGSATA